MRHCQEKLVLSLALYAIEVERSLAFIAIVENFWSDFSSPTAASISVHARGESRVSLASVEMSLVQCSKEVELHRLLSGAFGGG